MKIKPDISIITITFNSAKFIGSFIHNLYLDKEYIKELIIIENNSHESAITENIVLNEIKKNLINIKFIKSRSNLGFGKGCNLGAKISTGKYLLFLNPDTEIRTKTITNLYMHLIDNNADIIGGKSFKNRNSYHKSVVRRPDLAIGLFEFSNLGKLFNIKYGNKKFYYKDLNILSVKNDVVVDAVSGANLLIKQKVFKTLNGFDQKFFMYLEDVDLCIRANNLGMKVLYCPHSIINHIGGASSKNRYRINHQSWYDSRKYYFMKHHNFLVNMIIQPVFYIDEFISKIRINL